MYAVKQVLYHIILWRRQHERSCMPAQTMCAQHALAGVDILTRHDQCMRGSVQW